MGGNQRSRFRNRRPLLYGVTCLQPICRNSPSLSPAVHNRYGSRVCNHKNRAENNRGFARFWSTTQLITRSDGNRRQTSFFPRQIPPNDRSLRRFSRREKVVARESLFGLKCPPETPNPILFLRFFSGSKGLGNYSHHSQPHPCSPFSCRFSARAILRRE